VIDVREFLCMTKYHSYKQTMISMQIKPMYTVSTEKQSHRIVSIISFNVRLTGLKFQKSEGLIPESTHDTTAVAFPTKHCNTLT